MAEIVNPQITDAVTQTNKHPLKSKKVWAGIIGLVLAGLAALAKLKFNIDGQTIYTLLGIAESIVISFIGFQSWQDGKVYSTVILTEAEKIIHAVQTANKKPE